MGVKEKHTGDRDPMRPISPCHIRPCSQFVPCWLERLLLEHDTVDDGAHCEQCEATQDKDHHFGNEADRGIYVLVDLGRDVEACRDDQRQADGLADG